MKVYSENKKALFDYEILEKFEAGLVLVGQEVKSIRTGHMQLNASYVIIRNGQPELLGSKVPPYQPNNTKEGYDPEHTRKLLLNRKEIDYLAGRTKQKGFSLIPLKVFDKDGRIKLEFALCKGKKEFDKKEKIKKRDVEREIQRQFK